MSSGRAAEGILARQLLSPLPGLSYDLRLTGGSAASRLAPPFHGIFDRLLASGPPGLAFDAHACLDPDLDLVLDLVLDLDYTTAVRRNAKSPAPTSRCVRFGAHEPQSGGQQIAPESFAQYRL